MLREQILSFHYKENIFFPFFFSSFFSFLLYLYEKMNASCIYCGNHFTIYVNLTITLHALNSYMVYANYFSNKTRKNIKLLYCILGSRSQNCTVSEFSKIYQWNWLLIPKRTSDNSNIFNTLKVVFQRKQVISLNRNFHFVERIGFYCFQYWYHS